jgi:hypothetical protein
LIVNEVLAKCQTSALKKINWLLAMENKAPFTANEHYYKDYKEKIIKSYREARAPEFRGGICNMRIEQLISQDPYEPALHHMASARAYFQGPHWLKALNLE